MPHLFLFLVIILLISPCSTNGQQELTDRPLIFLNPELLQEVSTDQHQQLLFAQLEAAALEDGKLKYLDLSTDFPGRDPVHLKHENLSYDMARGICERLGRSALMYVVKKDPKFKERILDQITVLFDDAYFPEWCDDAHMHKKPYVDIRTYRISMWVALCYNWLYDDLSQDERTWIIEGLDRKAIQPFWEKIAQKPGWYRHRHNWFTNMYGGMGITMMALHQDHPDLHRALDTIVPAMLAFNQQMGAKGEFNEPPGYVGAVRFQVEFAEAYRTYTQGQTNVLGQHPFPELGYWIMHHTLPPGHLAAFGDTNPHQALSDPAIVAAIASASKDPVLQWHYLGHTTPLRNPLELLWYDPALTAQPPGMDLPLAVAYPEYGADIISRTGWDIQSEPSVVYSKAGRETNHDDNDVGQVCINGYGVPLIIDCGKPKPIYPKDYFSSSQFNYYSRSSLGHNVIRLNDEEMLSEPNEKARGVVDTFWSDNAVGAFWSMDLSAVFPRAQVHRTVVHLHSGLVAVYDQVLAEKSTGVDLRWHTASEPFLSTSDCFNVEQDGAKVTARIDGVGHHLDSVLVGHHEYVPPYHLTRQGDPLDQDYEDYIRVFKTGREVAFMSLFFVHRSSDDIKPWSRDQNHWSVEGPQGIHEIDLTNEHLFVRSGDTVLLVPIRKL